MEVIVPILLIAIGGLLVALVIIGDLYNELKKEYNELECQYFRDYFREVFEGNEKKED